MKTEKLFDLSEDETLPFSFKKKEVSDNQIKAHWEEIMKKINEIGDNKESNTIPQ